CPMKRSASATLVVAACMAAVWTAAFIAPHAQSRRGNDQGNDQNNRTFDRTIAANARDLFARGRDVFRHDTFGDEHFWRDTIHLHQAIEGARFGGVGDGISPATALALGLKVDAAALPESLIEDIKHGRVNLNDPATTLALLRLNAVVGVVGFGNNGKGGLQ